MSWDKIRVGLVGYGYWGRNLARVLHGNSKAELCYLAETSGAAVEQCLRLYPQVKVVHAEDLADRSDVDAVVIATRPETHFNFGYRMLHAGKHTMVEKPLALDLDHARHLCNIADAREVKLAVDHTFVHSPAVCRLRSLTTGGEVGKLGRLQYYDSIRANLGLFQSECDVMWDLAPHDLAILDSLIGGQLPIQVSARTFSHFPGQRPNLAYLLLEYPDNLVAHLNLSWASPVKLRHTLIAGTKKMVVYDDVEPDHKIQVYDKGIDIETEGTRAGEALQRVSYRQGDLWVPKLQPDEPLAHAVDDFLTSIIEDYTPLTDGRQGLRVVAICKAAEWSAGQLGRTIRV